MIYLSMGDTFRTARERLQLTKAELSRITAISPTSIHDYEADRYLPRPYRFKKLCWYLDLYYPPRFENGKLCYRSHVGEETQDCMDKSYGLSSEYDDEA